MNSPDNALVFAVRQQSRKVESSATSPGSDLIFSITRFFTSLRMIAEATCLSVAGQATRPPEWRHPCRNRRRLATWSQIQVLGMDRGDVKPRGEFTLTRLPLRYQS
jgi:hypothetical protein